MGMELMSKRELNRIDVLARLDGGRLTPAAADLMRLTQRQTHRLLKRYRDGGAAAIANRRRGRPSNNRPSEVVRDHAIALVRKYYSDFGPTLAAERLFGRHDVRVSRETLRGWMQRAGRRSTALSASSRTFDLNGEPRTKKNSPIFPPA
jgi:transposase